MPGSSNSLYNTPATDASTKVDDSTPGLETTEKLINEPNPLHQSPSSISSKPEVAQKSQCITNMQERYNNSVFVNFLNSMLPN